jgi:hypothetical protein
MYSRNSVPQISDVRPFSDDSIPIFRQLLHDSEQDVVVSAIYALARHKFDAGDLAPFATSAAADVRDAIQSRFATRSSVVLAIPTKKLTEKRWSAWRVAEMFA